MDETTIPPGTSTARAGNFGLVPVANMQAIIDEAKRQVEKANEPVLTGLAAHVERCWVAAKTDKLEVEQRMLSNLRARRGEYDPHTLTKIRMTGGSEVFMMLSSSKARAATSWVRSTLMGTGDEKPWSLACSKEPNIPPEAVQIAIQKAASLVQQIQDMYGGPQAVPDSMVADLFDLAHAREKHEVLDMARKDLSEMEDHMEAQLQEGGFPAALYEFSDDLSTFPAAIIKGPVIRMLPKLDWQQGADGEFEAVVTKELSLGWERVSPFHIYPSPKAIGPNDGYLFEFHELYVTDLEALKGVEGYSEKSINEVIDLYGQTGHRIMTPIDTAKVEAEGRMTTGVSDTTSPVIDALQFWGPVLGKMLIEYGMTKEQIPDPTAVYHCEVWKIGGTIIKATLNYDPLGRRPYYKASWEEIPGAFWGNSPVDLIRDCQTVCNNAARALCNNMAVASGPQVDVNVNRVPAGEDITNMYPWKVWQTQSDPFGSAAPPINFFQPQSNAQELMTIYLQFASIADDVSGIPKYMTGESVAGGAGRTASGLSMMLQNAGQALKSVLANIDNKVISQVIERLYYYNMKYGTEKALKRLDIRAIPRGATSLVAREQAQQRRNEFLQLVLQSPQVQSIIGPRAVAALLRTMAQGLNMDADEIVPTDEEIKGRMFQQQEQQVQQQMVALHQAAAGAAGVPPGPGGPPPGPPGPQGPAGPPPGQPVPGVMPNQQNQQLPHGAGPVTNHFTPPKGA